MTKNMNTRRQNIIREHSRACFQNALPLDLTPGFTSHPLLSLVSSNSIQSPGNIPPIHYTYFTGVRTKCIETKTHSLTLVWGLPIVLCRSLELFSQAFCSILLYRQNCIMGASSLSACPCLSILSYTEIFPPPNILQCLDSHFWQ